MRSYMAGVVRALILQGTRPAMVQIGNEITAGILWNDGRVGGSYNTSQQWKNLADLIRSAVQGVRESGEGADSIRIMLHIDRGGDNKGARWFFDSILAQGIEFDVIGLSFYPWWHGTLDAVRANVNDLAGRYGKDILIAETAYPWTFEWHDFRNNIVSDPDDLLPGYPASVEGQADFLRSLICIVRNIPGGRGLGVLYWAPEYISVDPIGSSWENNTLFDFEGNALASMDVFTEGPVHATPVQVTLRLNTSTMADTLEEHHFAQIRGEISGLSSGMLPDGREVTWDSGSELVFTNAGGDYWEAVFPMYPGDRLSYKFWTGFSRVKGNFQRLGWEGPVVSYSDPDVHERLLIAGETDTVVGLQYFNSSADARPQYWAPFEKKADSIAVYFRVNMGKAASSGCFDPSRHGPVAVRGDSAASGGILDWDVSRLLLVRESFSVSGGSFWSGVCYFPVDAVQSGRILEYRYFVENGGDSGWEGGEMNRRLVWTGSLIERGDTTLHWDYFIEPPSSILSRSGPPESTEDFHLFPNHPNPFNNSTRIDYRLYRASHVSLEIFDMQGKRVAVLADQRQSAGCHSVTWDAKKPGGTVLPSGLYIIRLRTQAGMNACKTLLVQ